MLYDEEFIKSMPAAKQFENPWLLDICTFERSKRLRALIEKWFTNIPKEQKAKLRSRLRSLDNSVFVPAFYELMAHQYCLEEGWTVEYEPELKSGLTPDFVVTTKTGYKFVLEVATIFDSADVQAQENIKQEVTQSITAIDTPFSLELQFRILPTEGTYTKVITRMVRDWLKKLDPEDKTTRHECNFGYKGLAIGVTATKSYPKPKGGCVYMVMDPGGAVPDYTNRIKSVLDDKANKYSSKKTGLPLVVMLGDGVGRIRLSEHTIDRALFGRDTITFGDDSNPPVWRKDRSGHFTPSSDENLDWIGRRTGLSAVIYSSLREQGSFQMQVFHNPFPNIQLAENTFYKMPQLTKWEGKAGIIMKWIVSNPEVLRMNFEVDSDEQEP